MLGRRVAAAVIIVFPALGLFWLDAADSVGPTGIWLTSLALLVAILACAELVGLLRHNVVRPIAWPAFLGTALVVIASAVPELFWGTSHGPIGRWGWVALALVATLFCALLHEMLRFDVQRNSTTRAALTLLVVIYSGGLMAFLVATRLMLPGPLGVLAVFSVVFVVKTADTGAYFVGRACGSNRLAPRLSPQKTIEGLIGGVAAACLASWVTFAVVMPWFIATEPRTSWLLSIAYGASLSAAGVFGDLAESLLKRDMQRKDSSNWLPGLGGVLDVLDSVLIAAPVAFLWWTTGWLRP